MSFLQISYLNENHVKPFDSRFSECPSKPQLTLDNMDNPNISPYFKCKSDGSPRPKVQWSG